MSRYQSVVVDDTELEGLVTGYREHSLFIDEFVLENVDREMNCIRWTFVFECHEPRRDLTNLEIKVRTLMGSEVVVSRLTYPYGMELLRNDRMVLTYTLEWWYRGGDGDDPQVVRPYPTPGATLEYLFTAA